MYSCLEIVYDEKKTTNIFKIMTKISNESKTQLLELRIVTRLYFYRRYKYLKKN